MKKLIYSVFFASLLVGCDYNQHLSSEKHSGDSIGEAIVKENTESSNSNINTAHGLLFNHLDFDIEVFIKEKDGLIRPGLYDKETKEPISLLEANSFQPYLDIRLQENITLIVNFSEFSENKANNFKGVKYYSDDFLPNSILVKQYDNGEYGFEFYFHKVDDYVGYLRDHIIGHLCEPNDPECKPDTP